MGFLGMLSVVLGISLACFGMVGESFTSTSRLNFPKLLLPPAT